MSVLIWFNSLLVLENDTCNDGSECVIVIIVFSYVIYIVTKFIKKKNKKKLYKLVAEWLCVNIRDGTVTVRYVCDSIYICFADTKSDTAIQEPEPGTVHNL